MAYKLGMVSSTIDDRDWKIPMSLTTVSPITTKYRANKYDQGTSNECAYFSLAQWMEASESKQRGVQVRFSTGFNNGVRGENDYKGEGTMPREMLMQATIFGLVKYDLFPVSGTYEFCKEEVSKKWNYLEGEWLSSRIKGFVKLNNMQEVYSYMSEYGFGILYGQHVYESFFKTGTDGIVPTPSGNLLGGHMQYAPDIVLKNGKLLLATQNTWKGWGDNQMGYVNPSEQKGVEMWGPIPDNTKWYSDMPNAIMMVVPKDKTKRNNYIYSDNKRIDIPVGPFYHDNKLCTAIREPFEAIGAKVKWQRMPDGSDITIIYPRGFEIKD